MPPPLSHGRKKGRKEGKKDGRKGRKGRKGRRERVKDEILRKEATKVKGER